MKKNPVWKKTTVAGLLLHTPSGKFYARFSVNGKRTFRALKTDVLTVAKLKHAKLGMDVEKDRQRGSDLGSDFKTMGALLAEVERRFKAAPGKPNTTLGRQGKIDRLKAHWQEGTFDTFLARNVTADVITRFRDHLLRKAKWKWKLSTKPREGYSEGTVNETLWLIRVMLDIAVEKLVLIENPFHQKTILRESLYCSLEDRGDKIKQEQADGAIPDRITMTRIFDEMRRIPDNMPGYKAPTAKLQWMKEAAEEMADHAELLAYSGMRKEEAAVSTLADDLGAEFKIWGTKSKASNRTIAVNPALRVVLDRYKLKRVGAKTKLVRFQEPRVAIARACERLGLPKVTNHGLRHLFASVCIASGVDIPTVSRWLGHGDGGVLAMTTYGHLLKDASIAAAAKVDFTGAPQVRLAQ